MSICVLLIFVPRPTKMPAGAISPAASGRAGLLELQIHQVFEIHPAALERGRFRVGQVVGDHVDARRKRPKSRRGGIKCGDSHGDCSNGYRTMTIRTT